MKKFFKYLLLVFTILFILSCIFWITKFNSITVDSKISNSQQIKSLDRKIFWNFGFNKPEKNSTDFAIGQKYGDTILFNCYALKSPKIKNLDIITFGFSTGYNGTNVVIFKYGNAFTVDVDDFSDVERTDDFFKQNQYKIIKQKLTLNKENYKTGDSIYGKLELKIKNKETEQIEMASGYFRTEMK
ncbi:hypothetical protein [Chryseobacterium caseinilyticum]|uniref:Lipoprotein n=1 Tax=Chryseobacterium caseinilyticum TaxID=2771428 RepID=A0ABR8Z9F5_9FLAO|nr:hypothetical protein [Chryseobacterium caseinilyticum]MBD8081886.1 hypothetical protein [Chryseobacterium caseinilyticum]